MVESLPKTISAARVIAALDGDPKIDEVRMEILRLTPGALDEWAPLRTAAEIPKQPQKIRELIARVLTTHTTAHQRKILLSKAHGGTRWQNSSTGLSENLEHSRP